MDERSDSSSTLRWLISCDESGVDGAKYYGFGSLWMRWERRGDFIGEFRRIHDSHSYQGEVKWNKVNSPRYLPCHRELVEFFFKRRWLAFHCIIVRKGMVDKTLHGGSYDLARRKHFTMFLARKIRQCVEARLGRDHTFRIWVDPIASRYRKAHEAVEVISNNVLAKALGSVRPVDKVIVRDSKETPAIQLCDLLLGAVMDAWQQRSTSGPKAELKDWIAHHLGWEDLQADTRPDERKFNIWYFHSPPTEPREAEMREVKLKYPLPERG